MSEDLIIKHCAPTLAGLKTGNIFNASYESEDELGTEATEVLRRFGYVPNDPDSCIEHLADRIAPGSGFPHEIGLFLGYPPEDVKGFMRYGGKGCKACGYWKVYGDKDAAEKRFAQFSKCTGVYLKHMKCGAGLEKLAVRKH